LRRNRVRLPGFCYYGAMRMGRMLQKAREALWAQWSKRTAAENKFLLLVPLVGVATGLTGVGIAHLMSLLQNLLWGGGPNLLQAAAAMPWQMRILIPAAGGAAVGLLGRWFAVQTRGAGTATMVQAIALKGGYVSLRQSLPRVAAGMLTVASGGSLGREGPITQFGGAVGSYLGRRFGLSTQQVRILVCTAAGSAIAAVYNSPIGGSLFALEILMGNFALEIFGPVVVASVISTLIFRSAMGDLPRFVIPEALREGYRLVSGWELLAYLVLGIVGGIVSVLLVKSLFWSESAFERLRLPRWTKPVIGFALVGVIAVFYPHVLGNGFETTNMAMHEHLPLEWLLVLALLKVVATSLTLGSGGAGGLFMPTLMIGSLVGGAYGMVVHGWFPELTASHGAYALVGMGAIVAGTTHAPLTAIMMVFEQTNSYHTILPLMFVCIVSNFTVRAFRVQAVHIESLRRRGVALPRGPEESVMRNLRVADVMHEDVVAVKESAPFAAVVEKFLKYPHNYLYVVVGDNRFYGAISLHGLKEMLREADSLDSVIAYDLADDRFEFVTKDMRLADTMEKFWRQHCERLPVVDDPRERRLIGWISKRDLIGIYNQEILQKRHLMSRFRVAEAEHKAEVLVELPPGFQLRSVVVPPALAGRTLKELALRSRYGVQVVLLRRRDPHTGADTTELADAETRLAAEDRLLVVGSTEALAELELGLHRSVENDAHPG
jgi:CIC family chloride channel protein